MIEIKEDTVHSNEKLMVEIEHLYPSRSDMLISIFKKSILLKIYRQVQGILSPVIR